MYQNIQDQHCRKGVGKSNPTTVSVRVRWAGEDVEVSPRPAKENDGY